MEHELPDEWTWGKLGDVSNIVMGQSPPGDTYNENGDGIPFLQGKSEFSDVSPIHVKYTTNPNKIAPEGSVLISVRAPVGDVNIANIDYCIGRGLASVSLKDGSNKYLFYVLRHLKPKIESQGTGSTFMAISKPTLSNLIIPLPSLDVQQKIVSILEKAEETKRLRAQADELTQQLLKSVFLEMFGDPRTNPYKWEFRRIKDISEKFSDGPFGSNLKSEHYKSDGIRVIRLQNIGVCNFIDDDKAFISEEHFSTLKLHTCFPRDVIIGTMGSPNLRACMLPDSIQIALNKADCIQCRPDENIALSEYICYLLNLPSTLQMASNMIHGQTRSRISMGNLSMLEIPIPPIELQRNYAAIVQKLSFTKQYQQQSSQQINTLFDSLMQKAFAGELVC